MGMEVMSMVLRLWSCFAKVVRYDRLSRFDFEAMFWQMEWSHCLLLNPNLTLSLNCLFE